MSQSNKPLHSCHVCVCVCVCVGVCQYLTSLMVVSCCLRRLVKSISLSPFWRSASSTSYHVRIRASILASIDFTYVWTVTSDFVESARSILFKTSSLGLPRSMKLRLGLRPENGIWEWELRTYRNTP